MNDIAPKHKRGKRTEPVNYAAKGMSNGVVANLDLAEPLNKMHCRDCGQPVPSNRATCPHCEGKS